MFAFKPLHLDLTRDQSLVARPSSFASGSRYANTGAASLEGDP
jgi:hypothetical protein